MSTKVTALFPRLRRPLRLVAHPVHDSHAYTACAIRDVISETVDVDYRSSRVDDPADRGVEYDR